MAGDGVSNQWCFFQIGDTVRKADEFRKIYILVGVLKMKVICEI